MEEMVQYVAGLEDKLLNLTRLVRCTQTFTEEQEEAHKQQLLQVQQQMDQLRTGGRAQAYQMQGDFLSDAAQQRQEETLRLFAETAIKQRCAV